MIEFPYLCAQHKATARPTNAHLETFSKCFCLFNWREHSFRSGSGHTLQVVKLPAAKLMQNACKKQLQKTKSCKLFSEYFVTLHTISKVAVNECLLTS